MSLVINANTSWWWWYQVSNTDITIQYPDVNNNILLFIDCWYNAVWTASQPTAYSVNWTIVNYITWTLVVPNDIEMHGVVASSAIVFPPESSILLTASTAWTIRVWTATPLTSWMIIWKTIIVPQTRFSISWNITPWSLTVKVWILHSDWTITYMAQETQSAIWTSWNVNPMSVWQQANYSCYVYWETKVVKTNWYTTQEWDYIIYEYNIWNDFTGSRRLIFWNHFPTYQGQLINPVQISID